MHLCSDLRRLLASCWVTEATIGHAATTAQPWSGYRAATPAYRRMLIGLGAAGVGHVRPALRTAGSAAHPGRRPADRCLPGGPVPVGRHLGCRPRGPAVVVAGRPDRPTAGDEDRDLDRRRRRSAGRPEPRHRVAARRPVLRGSGPGRSARPGDDVPARRGAPALHRRGRGGLHLRHHDRRRQRSADGRTADRADRLATRAGRGRGGLPGRRDDLPPADAAGPILHPGNAGRTGPGWSATSATACRTAPCWPSTPSRC